jgi:2-phosphoglycolate phosphatase
MAQIDLVIFDFDGTLVDTAPDLVRAANLFLKSRGAGPLPADRIRAEIGMGLRKLIIDLYPELHYGDENEKRKIEGEFLAIYEREFLFQPALFPGAREFLGEWDGQIAIVSNKRVRFIHPILEKLEIHHLPWVTIVGGDSYLNMKPHPEPILAAIHAAGVSPDEAVIVGDGLPDVEGALAVGCKCVAVEFGYTPYQELLALGADASLASFEDLLELIREL